MIHTGAILQVLSTFTAHPLAPVLQRMLKSSRTADDVGFTPPHGMREYMLAPASDTEHILGTVVLLRVEDWLRNIANPPPDSSGEASARQELQTRVRDFVNELTILAYRGKPVWFLACPSTGWICERGNLVSLSRTYTNLLVARVRNVAQVTTLNWPAALSGDSVDDRQADQLKNIPYTQYGFDQLAEFLAAQVGRTLARSAQSASQIAAGASPELARYLAGLCVQVEIAPAGESDRGAVDRIMRTAASFSLTGEKPDMSDRQVDTLIASGRCLLVSVCDRLGDHGPSGVLVYGCSADDLIIEELSLSCTVLGKQVEYAVVSALAQLASERSCSKLVFEYKKSARNQPMLIFLQSLANRETETRYVLPQNLAVERISAKAINPGAWSRGSAKAQGGAGTIVNSRIENER